MSLSDKLEIKKIVDEKYSKEKVKIVALTGYNIGCKAQFEGEKYWSEIITSVANLNDKGEVEKGKMDFTVYRADNDGEFLKFDNVSVYEITCRKQKNKDNSYYILKYEKTTKYNNLFAELIKENSEDKYWNCQNIKFKLDRRVNLYTAKTKLNGKKLDISLDVPESCETVLTNFISNFDVEYKNILKECAKQLLHNANEWNEKQITEKEFIERLSKSALSIEIVNNELLGVYLDDDDMFLGHTIVYYEDLKTKGVRVDIVG